MKSALKIKDNEKTAIILSILEKFIFVFMIIKQNSISKINEKAFSNIKKFFPIKIVLIIIQKNAINIMLGISKIIFLHIPLLSKKQLIAASANGTQEPNGAITMTGQINNEIIIKVL